MSTDFCTSKTKTNLMRSFAGETQAHMRYIFAKQTCTQQKHHSLAALFNFTAMQEKEHAEVFYNYLKQCNGETIEFSADYPINESTDICKLLEEAINNERHEAEEVYPEFAETARKEGFGDIANHFENIATIERSHAERFQTFLDLMLSEKLYASAETERWVCLNCGYILESTSAPEQCPVCNAEQGYYIRLSMSSWGI